MSTTEILFSFTFQWFESSKKGDPESSEKKVKAATF